MVVTDKLTCTTSAKVSTIAESQRPRHPQAWQARCLGGCSCTFFITSVFLSPKSGADRWVRVTFTSLSPEAGLELQQFPEALACSHCQASDPELSLFPGPLSSHSGYGSDTTAPGVCWEHGRVCFPESWHSLKMSFYGGWSEIFIVSTNS